MSMTAGATSCARSATAIPPAPWASPNHTEDYQYGDANWKDKLTARVINGVSYPVVSDAIGNITSYAGWTYAWQAGRQLASQTNSGGTVEYKYNADGLRVQKKRGSTVTDYILSGKNIAHMTVTGGHTLHFYYDAQDRPAQVQYNGTMYRYVHSLQGDILAILDSAGNTVVQYAYDAWGGKKTTTGSMAGTLGYYNPFRYRGYVYDEESWMYYLRSRYYYPELQRFISADSVIGIKSRSLSHNLWAYCYNSPIQHADSSGQVVGLIVVLSISFGGILFLDQYIANMNGLTRQEKELSRAYPVQAAIAKRAAESADRLTNEYFGPNATIADTTRANAFKHAVWNAIMVRDLGVNFAAGFASAHEENDLKNTRGCL